MSWNLEEAVSYYKYQGAPGDQSMLIALLREVQEEKGGISHGEVALIAEMLRTKPGVLLALIKRIPRLKIKDIHCLELCAGPNCGKHTALADFAEKLSKESAGKIEVKFTPCMRMCAKGPNIRWDGKLYHGATNELLMELIASKGEV